MPGPRRQFRILALLIVLLCAAATILYWWQLSDSANELRRETLAQAALRGRQLGAAITEQTEDLVRSIDASVRELVEFRLTAKAEEFDQEVRRTEQRFSEGAVLQVAVIDAAGQLVYSSLDFQGSIYLGDREHFKVHAQGGDSLFISKPVLGRVSQRWSIQFSRALRRDGAFDGVVVLSLSPDYLYRALAQLGLGADDAASILRANGEYLARSHLHDGALGKAVPAGRPFLAGDAPASGAYTAAAAFDGVLRMYQWQRLRDYPLIVVLGLGEQAILKPAEQAIAGNRRYALAGSFALWACALAFLLLLARMSRQQRLLIERSQELERAEATLRASEARYRSVVDNVKEAVFQIDSAGRWTFLNPAWEEITGFPVEAALGTPFVDYLHAEDRPQCTALFDALVRGGEDSCRHEARFLTRAGGQRWIEVLARLTRDAAGEVAGVSGTLSDITDRRQAEAELERHRNRLEDIVQERTLALSIAKEAAEAANRAKSTFLATMSHELRTPMNAIIGLTHLMARRSHDADQRDKLDKILQSANHLLQLLNDILDLSKIDAERLTLERAPFALGEVCANLQGLVGFRAEAKGLALRVQLDPALESLQLLGDPLRLQQVLLNLVGNAIKFSERGAIVVGVRPAQESERDLLIDFEVADDGIGMTRETVQRVFEPFEQADGSITRKYGGTGLGLPICKRLVRLMGGELAVASAPGLGSTFSFSLRFERAGALPPALRAAQAPPDAEQRLRSEFAGARVLVAEDDPVNQEVVLDLLREVLGFRVDLAADGLEAVDLARRGDYAAIIMDVQMPVLDGLEATRRIRGLAQYEGIPIIALTANAFAEDRRACLEAGMDDFIAKPMDPVPMFQTLLRWLDRSGGAPARAAQGG